MQGRGVKRKNKDLAETDRLFAGYLETGHRRRMLNAEIDPTAARSTVLGVHNDAEPTPTSLTKPPDILKSWPKAGRGAFPVQWPNYPVETPPVSPQSVS